MSASEIRDQLERLLDRCGSASLLVEALAVIAGEKEAHVLANWQDEATAKLWRRVANSLDREAERLLKIGNPY